MVTKRVFIVHGWDGSPSKDFLPWLKKELVANGFEVHALTMPGSDRPVIEKWLAHLKKEVVNPDENTYFVGHSMGTQAILRYLESLPKNIKVGGIVLVAAFIRLTDESFPTDEDYAIAKPWMEGPIDFERIAEHTTKITAILSDNDPYVSLENAEIFKNELDAKIIIEHDMGHFNTEDGVTKVLSALGEVLRMAKDKSHIA
jgi:hypothetical protein